MGLNISKGNMYEFVTHTWNAIKGACLHDCSYCYMKRWGKLKPVRLDEKEFKTDLGSGNFIFVGSSCDMFAADIPSEWIQRVIGHCKKFNNKYLLQTKNPARYHEFDLPQNFILGCTIETNRVYPCMGNTPKPRDRAMEMFDLENQKFITIEPILDFDIGELSVLINFSNVEWVNIGADSTNSGLPEPSKEKTEQLIALLAKKITIKKNMKRITGVK